MILFIEGPRKSGKTFLINQFIETCTNPNVQYYKFYFADHVKTLGLSTKDHTPDLHYFSLGNIMTILEMNLLPENKDKIWIFDRAIISAYTWAILRNRLTRQYAQSEYLALLKSNLFKNCKTLLIKVAIDTEDSSREKDLWDGTHSTSEELQLMTQLINLGWYQLTDGVLGNDIASVFNRFDESSIANFNLAINTAIE